MATLSVTGNGFMSRTPSTLTVGSVNADPVLFVLDDSWDGLTVFAAFRNDKEGVERHVLLGDDLTCTIPWECLTQPGTLNVGLLGLRGADVVKPTIWLTYGYVVDGVDPEAGDDPQPPTPSWEQQMVEQATAAANAAKAAKETADNLQAAAEAGEFDGDPGPEGPPGRSPIIRNKTWWIWNNDSQDYTDTGVVASGGGGGVSSYNDLSDRPKIGGVLLEGNKTAQDLGLQPKGDYATTSSKLANPYSITFTGAVEATYDGSEAKTVTIPTKSGEDGFSPTIKTAPVEGGTRFTITNKDGTETVDILNGKDGQDGKTPVKGIDYFTPDEIQSIAEQAAALVPGGGGGESKEWKLFQTIDFSEEYADGVMSWEWTDLDFEELVFIATGLTNINESANSGLQIAVNDTTLMILDTQKKTGATETKYQRAGIFYNGLYWEPTKRQQSNNEQSYYSMFTNTLSPYSVKTDIGKCERLKLNPNAPSYNMYSGILKVYAR